MGFNIGSGHVQENINIESYTFLYSDKVVIFYAYRERYYPSAAPAGVANGNNGFFISRASRRTSDIVVSRRGFIAILSEYFLFKNVIYKGRERKSIRFYKLYLYSSHSDSILLRVAIRRI